MMVVTDARPSRGIYPNRNIPNHVQGPALSERPERPNWTTLVN